MPWNICKCTLCQCIWYVPRKRKQCTIREENKTQDCNNNNLLIINSSCSLFCCFGCLFLIFISLFFLFALLFPSVACVLVFHLQCSHFVWYEHFCKCKHTLQLVYFFHFHRFSVRLCECGCECECECVPVKVLKDVLVAI